jgi:lysophospholipase L1-like esterase
MIRRTFVKDAAVAAVAVSGLTGGLGALSGLMAQPRPHSGSRILRVNGQTRPFNMVCLGDSIMWGQGLQDSNKFSAQIESWLERKLPGRPVNRFVFARSGATIGADAEIPDRSRVEAWMNDRRYGEVPSSWPWITEQVAVARADLATQVSASAVDLVLVDGGANDVGISYLLNPTNTEAGVRQMSTDKIAGQMPALLAAVGNTFPNAKILVTGYYPIVSEDSNLAAVGMLLALVGAVFSPFALSLPLPIVAAPLTVEARRVLTGLSTAWYDASNSDLGAAVSSYNDRWKALHPSYKTLPATFVKIPWGPSHSYAAPDTRLWLVGLPEDEVYSARASGCVDTGRTKTGKSGLCLEAKSGHPNPAGATAYAAACQAQLGKYLAEWSGLKLMSACVEMDPIPTPGKQTSLTVYATADGPVGRQRVPATVHVGSQTFPTDQPLPVTLCTNRRVTSIDRSGLKPTREVLGTALTCEPITVSATGYADVVIRDYLKAYALP